jgi:hypothetical protein
MIEQNGTYLGRFQAGAVVPLRVWTVDRSTNGPTLPDQAPWLRVYGPGGVTAQFIPRMPTDDFWGILGLFRWPLRLGVGLPVGTYAVVYSYLVNRRIHVVRDQFEVVGGSDASGTVISLFCQRHPETTYVLAQLDSGRLVLGRNPKV